MSNKPNRKGAQKPTVTGNTLNLMTILEPGEHFFFDGKAGTVTAYASIKKVKVTTETVMVIENLLAKNEDPTTRKIIKVTVQ
jgi:hypothetical protein